jgi:UPF0755 protein
VNPAVSRLLKWLCSVVGLLLVLGALGAFYLWSYYRTPAAAEAEDRIVSIAPGTSLSQIASELTEAGLLRHRLMFILYVQWLRPGPHLQAGEYVLRATMSPVQIAEILRQGKVRQYTLTIPEGLTIRELAALIGDQGFGDPHVIRELARDATFIASLGLTVPSLEGYLFPDTYHLPRHLHEQALLTLMVRTLQRHYTADIAAQAERLGLSQHSVLTLASLIEKEARVDEERSQISAVYHNRLERRMRLQCDPTVIYALGELFDGNIRKPDLSIDSPYNTYRYPGLPPGPIANAGRRSIEAAVAPADVDYLYFVATGEDGRHYFSKTFQEHSQAVRKYQLRQVSTR